MRPGLVVGTHDLAALGLARAPCRGRRPLAAAEPPNPSRPMIDGTAEGRAGRMAKRRGREDSPHKRAQQTPTACAKQSAWGI